MSQFVESYSKNSFECAELEFELLISKFRVAAKLPMFQATRCATNSTLNKFH